MRVVCLSDTHHLFEQVLVPDGDLLVHTGDHSRHGGSAEVMASAAWLRSLPHKHKVVLAGNHDFCLQDDTVAADLFADFTYLRDQAVVLEGLRIYGSPWTPGFGKWAFQFEPGASAARVWAQIPEGTQLLLTHGPPARWGDLTRWGLHAGCPQLLERVRQVRPLLHVYGHIHEGYGLQRDPAGTWMLNASSCAYGYLYQQPPHVFDWDGQAFHPVAVGTPAEPLWQYLLAATPRPRRLAASEWEAACHLRHAFVLRPGHPERGEGGVVFEAPGPRAPYPEQPLQHGWALTLEWRLDNSWYGLLNRNRWPEPAAVPQLSELLLAEGGQP